MLIARKVSFWWKILASVLLCSSAFARQMKEPVPPAPVPVQIQTGRKVFLAYAGINIMTLNPYIVESTGALNGLYDEFYDAIRHWEGYQLVPAPAAADLVLELSLNQIDKDPRFILRVLDPKTNVLLWKFMQSVSASDRNHEKKLKGWEDALKSLADQMKDLAGQSTATTGVSDR